MVVCEKFSLVLFGQNALIREGLCRILSDGTFEVIGSATHVDDICSQTGVLDPDMIVMDQVRGSIDDCEVEKIQAIFPRARVVLLVDEFDFEGVLQALRIGADGYIVKNMECESLLASLRLVAMGEKVLPSQLAQQLTVHMPGNSLAISRSSNLTEILSEREIETLRYLLMGCPNKVIANQLDVSEATVKVHVKAILRKLRVQNRTQAAIWAVNNGIDFASSAPAPAATPTPQPMRMTA